MVDQDVQAALGVTLYQGRWALILDSVGELGCRESCLTVRVGVWGKWATQHTFPKFCAFVTKES